MSDNVNYTEPGSGTIVAFRDDGAAKHQRCDVEGKLAHDAAAAAALPILVGFFASAAAPSNVSADGDATKAWCLLNGSQVINIAAGGTLITATSTSLNTNITNSSLAITVAAGPTSFVKLEDVASANGDAGSPAMAVQKATPANTADSDGDYEFLQMSAGRLWCSTIVTSLPTLAAVTTVTTVTTVSTVTAVTDITNWGNIVDNAGFTDGTTRLLMSGYIFDETAGTSLTENDGAAARIDSKRAQIVTLEDGTTRGLRCGVVDETGSSAVDAQAMGGGTPHDSVNSGNPLYLGAEAIAHGTNPTAVAAADRTKLYANRAGIPFVMGGHPNVVTIELATTGAQTDTAIVTISTGLKIVVTQVQVVTDNANTAFPQIRVGFGATNTPTTTGVVLTHPGLPAGGGVSRGDGSGILGVGADGEDLRVTCGAPTGGSLRILTTYYTIES